MKERAKQIIEKIMYATLATVSDSGEPWNSPVYVGYDENYCFYWASWQENQHSKNIDDNGKVFIVIYDSTVPEGTGEGVYIKATAEAMSDPKEIQKALDISYGRKNKTPRKAEEFLGEYPRRFYKATPEKIWMYTDGKVDGNFVDTREEVEL